MAGCIQITLVQLFLAACVTSLKSQVFLEFSLSYWRDALHRFCVSTISQICKGNAPTAPLPPQHTLPFQLRASSVPGGPTLCLNPAVVNTRRALPLSPSKVNLLTGGKEGEQESRSQRSFNNRPGGKSPHHHHLPQVHSGMHFSDKSFTVAAQSLGAPR